MHVQAQIQDFHIEGAQMIMRTEREAQSSLYGWGPGPGKL